jgi:hypothetical protein
MNIRQDRSRPFGVGRRSEDSIACETAAICTAYAWLALYGIAVAGAFLGAWHGPATPIVAAAPAQLERIK